MARTKSSNPKQVIPKSEEFVTDGKPNKFCWDYIETLAKVVVAKYFAKYFTLFDKDDLVSLAITDAVSFFQKTIDSGAYKNMQNVRNVLFTRIRNTLSNFIFRSNKLVSTDDEILDLVVVYPKTNSIKHDVLDLQDLSINSIDDFRTISLKAWNLYKPNAKNVKYTINDSNNSINDWETYSEVKNMKSPCDLLSIYDYYTEDQIENLANKLDSIAGQNYFNTLYQLLGDKFLAFLDVFQEDKLDIPSTTLVKNLLIDDEVIADYSDGLTISELANKYGKSESSIKRILNSQEII